MLGLSKNTEYVEVARVQLPSQSWTSEPQIKQQATMDPHWGGGDQDPRTCVTEQQCSLAATRDFSGKTTVSASLHKSGLCGRVARWQKAAAWSLQKGSERFEVH